jgi:dipeptidyl-peptidase-4
MNMTGPVQCRRGAPRFLLAIAALLPAAPALPAGKSDDPGRLTLDRLFGGKDFQPEVAGAIRWQAGRPGYITRGSGASPKGGADLVRVDPATGKQEVLVAARHLTPVGASAPLAVEDYAFSADGGQLLIYTNSKRVWRRNTRGDYWVCDLGTHELHQLGGGAAPSSLMSARFSPDGRKVAYVRDRNLYVEDVATHHIEQLTHAGSPNVINGTFDWVYEEEFSLHDGFRWSPDGGRIAFWQLDTTGCDDYCLVNNTAGLYPRLTKFKYPKVGRTNAACRVGVVEVEPKAGGGHAVCWLPLPGDPREHYVARMGWADADTVLVQQLNRLQNTNAVFRYSLGARAVAPILLERDQAWVDVHDPPDFIHGGKRFTWLSERDGWRRVYTASLGGKDVKPITPSGVDVIGIARVDAKNGWLYYTASPHNATQKYLYRVRLDGSSAAKLTPENLPGTHAYQISPDGAWAVHTSSTFDNPPVTELIRLPGHERVRVLAENKKLRAAVRALKRLPTEFFRIDIGGGVELDGWCIKPPDFDPSRRYPVLFHVYGEPAGQTVLDRWGGQQYLWHLMLAQQGYLVMSVDNRGTPSPRGRDWRKVIYRQVGILAPADQAAAVKAIARRWPFVDPGRVGIWGWSGGGSMSLNAIFRYPDVYHTAMAVAPVSNQRYYDTIYQERYMGLPHDNSENYRDGSPITHAGKLKGHLLLVHGTGDDNVHYANTEALVNELIAANKQFTMMAYPNRSHGIVEGPNTRRHLFGLLTRYLHEHLPAGPKGR